MTFVNCNFRASLQKWKGSFMINRKLYFFYHICTFERRKSDKNTIRREKYKKYVISCILEWVELWLGFFWLFFLAFDFCRFCVVIWFFHPRHNGQWPPTFKDFYTRFYPLHYFLILILEKEPVFPFSMLTAKQWHYWYHFYNVFAMMRSLTGDWTRVLPHSKPALYH